MRLRVALAAEEAAGVRALRVLTARGHDVVAVFTAHRNRAHGTTVADVAHDLGLPVRPAGLIQNAELADELSSVDLLLNVYSLEIAHAGVVDAPRLGAFNLHPGPLPHYAGLNVVSWAIYKGERRHGVTLHRMTVNVDAGPIAFASDFEIAPTDTGLTLTLRCMQEGVPLVERLLAAAERGEPIPAIAQDLGRRRWFDRGPPDAGRLRWDRPAATVANIVRAADYRPFRSPWGKLVSRHEGSEIEVLTAQADGAETPTAQPGTVGERHGSAVSVAASDGWVRVERVRVHGKERDAAAVLTPGAMLSC